MNFCRSDHEPFHNRKEFEAHVLRPIDQPMYQSNLLKN